MSERDALVIPMKPIETTAKVNVSVSIWNKPTPLLVTAISSFIAILSVIFAGVGLIHGRTANQHSDEANRLATEANRISREAREEAKKANDIALKQLELSHLTPLLVLPVGFEPYVAESNNKAVITVLVANLSQTDYANEVNVNFIIDDGTGREFSSKSWNETIGEEGIIAVLPPGIKDLYSWKPDVPSKEAYATGQYKFKITTEVSWKSMAGKCYQFSDYSQLTYASQHDRFGFLSKRQSISEIECRK